MADPNAHSIRKRIRVSIHKTKAKLTTCFNPEHPSDMQLKISSPIAGTFTHQYHFLHPSHLENVAKLHPHPSNTDIITNAIATITNNEENPLPLPRSLSLPTTHPSPSTLLTNQNHTIDALRAALLASQTQTTTLKNQIELLNLQITRSEELATNNAALQREINSLKKALGTSKREFLRTIDRLKDLAAAHKQEAAENANEAERAKRRFQELRDDAANFERVATNGLAEVRREVDKMIRSNERLRGFRAFVISGGWDEFRREERDRDARRFMERERADNGGVLPVHRMTLRAFERFRRGL